MLIAVLAPLLPSNATPHTMGWIPGLAEATVQGLSSAQFGGLSVHTRDSMPCSAPLQDDAEVAAARPLVTLRSTVTKAFGGASAIFVSGWLPNLMLEPNLAVAQDAPPMPPSDVQSAAALFAFVLATASMNAMEEAEF